MFDKYRRARSAATHDGLGLGLYISRMIVEAHGGRIGVESAPGKGSTFFFEVPATGAVPGEASVVVMHESIVDDARAHPRGMHVLVVDDQPAAVSALGELLRDEGFVVSTATSGAEALAIVDTSRPDLVVLDVEMPGMSGPALLERLRARLPDVPAIFMTGYMAHQAGIAEARAATGAAYVSKPVNLDELIRTIALVADERA